MNYDKFDDMYYDISVTFKDVEFWIEYWTEIKTKEEVHIITQMITYIMLFLNIKYEDKARVEEVMKKLIAENKIKHINSCKSKEDITDFLEYMYREYRIYCISVICRNYSYHCLKNGCCRWLNYSLRMIQAIRV